MFRLVKNMFYKDEKYIIFVFHTKNSHFCHHPLRPGGGDGYYSGPARDFPGGGVLFGVGYYSGGGVLFEGGFYHSRGCADHRKGNQSFGSLSFLKFTLGINTAWNYCLL